MSSACGWPLNLRALWSKHAAALGLVCAALAFFALAGIGRDRGGATTPDRYVYVGAALLMPVISLALGGWMNRRPSRPAVRAVLRVTVVVVVLVFTFANANEGVRQVRQRTAFVLQNRSQILGTVQLLAEGQPDINRTPFIGSSLTAFHLMQLRRDGYLPHMAPLTASQRLYDTTRLDVVLTSSPLFKGGFTVRSTARVITTAGPGDCTVFAPADPRAGPGLPPAVRLALVPGERSASLQIRALGRTQLEMELASAGGGKGAAGRPGGPQRRVAEAAVEWDESPRRRRARRQPGGGPTRDPSGAAVRAEGRPGASP